MHIMKVAKSPRTVFRNLWKLCRPYDGFWSFSQLIPVASEPLCGHIMRGSTLICVRAAPPRVTSVLSCEAASSFPPRASPSLLHLIPAFYHSFPHSAASPRHIHKPRSFTPLLIPLLTLTSYFLFHSLHHSYPCSITPFLLIPLKIAPFPLPPTPIPASTTPLFHQIIPLTLPPRPLP